MGKLQVLDLMTKKVLTVKPYDSVATVDEMMDSHQIRHLPVVDDEGNFVGLISHRDLIRGVLSKLQDIPLAEQRDAMRSIEAQDIMTTGVETTEPDTDIEEAGQTMVENKFGYLPVLEGDQLVGILTEADFVKYVVHSE